MKSNIIIFLALSISIFLIGCTKDNTEITPPKEFGKIGTHQVSSFTTDDYEYSTIYYPSDLTTMTKKSPLIFFSSGWTSSPLKSTTYKTLITYMASHGYTVIYTYEGGTVESQYSIDGYNTLMENQMVASSILPYVDFNKIGVIGNSAGGGIAYTILDYYSHEKNYGANGRFIFATDPWFAFDMTEEKMKNLPSNTNVVVVKFGEGGNNGTDGSDARIPLTEYYLLESIPNKNKDYQIFADADHGYPKGDRDISEMQGILRPLDALLDYTFVSATEEARKVALENGNDDPYANGNGIQVVFPKEDYAYPCDGANTLIDYCDF